MLRETLIVIIPPPIATGMTAVTLTDDACAIGYAAAGADAALAGAIVICVSESTVTLKYPLAAPTVT